MKFEVGDKVRIRRNLKDGEEYNGVPFNEKMKKYKGETAEIIREISVGYELDIDDGKWCWSDDMFYPKESFLKANLKNGDIITTRNGRKGIIENKRLIFIDGTPWMDMSNYTGGLKPVFLNDEGFDIIEVKRPVKCKIVFERAEEEKKEILNEAEKEYLKMVIKPIKNKVKSIHKFKGFRRDTEYLMIYLEVDDSMRFPTFEKGTMYKGMRQDKKYTLKELGLEDED